MITKNEQIIILTFIMVFAIAVGVVSNSYLDMPKLLAPLNTALLTVLVLKDFSSVFRSD